MLCTSIFTLPPPPAFSSRLGYEEHIPGQTRDWNEELQTTRELPQKNLPERLIRERAIFKVATSDSQFIIPVLRYPVRWITHYYYYYLYPVPLPPPPAFSSRLGYEEHIPGQTRLERRVTDNPRTPPEEPPRATDQGYNTLPDVIFHHTTSNNVAGLEIRWTGRPSLPEISSDHRYAR